MLREGHRSTENINGKVGIKARVAVLVERQQYNEDVNCMINADFRGRFHHYFEGMLLESHLNAFSSGLSDRAFRSCETSCRDHFSVPEPPLTSTHYCF